MAMMKELSYRIWCEWRTTNITMESLAKKYHIREDRIEELLDVLDRIFNPEDYEDL